MAKILFETRGENYKVPGLPYEETFQYIRPIILDDIPTIAEVIKLIEETDDTTITNPWSLPVIKGFRDYIPTTFRRITQDMSETQFKELFGEDKNPISEVERTLFQLQTEIETKSSTIDAAIIHNRMDLGTIVNKIHVINRIYNIGRFYGHLKERESPILFGDVTDPKNWHNILSNVKQTFIDYTLEVPIGMRNYRKRIRHQDVSKKELEQYPFIEWFKEKLGNNFVGALLYGSAARTDDPNQFSDYDNWVKVKDISKAHQVLRGIKPAVYDGRVIENAPEHLEGMKHLGIHLMPDNDEYIYRYIRFLHDSVEFRKHTKVLYGEFTFPKVAMDEVVERGLSQAYIKLKTIVGSLNWAWTTPEKLIGKQSLYEFIVKNLRFFLQHSINALETPQFRDKASLNNLLLDRGFVLPTYKPDIEHIKQSLVYSMVGVLTLQKELYEKRPMPKLDFILGNDTTPEISADKNNPYLY